LDVLSNIIKLFFQFYFPFLVLVFQ
jgi:hypothetical protein